MMKSILKAATFLTSFINEMSFSNARSDVVSGTACPLNTDTSIDSEYWIESNINESIVETRIQLQVSPSHLSQKPNFEENHDGPES